MFFYLPVQISFPLFFQNKTVQYMYFSVYTSITYPVPMYLFPAKFFIYTVHLAVFGSVKSYSLRYFMVWWLSWFVFQKELVEMRWGKDVTYLIRILPYDNQQNSKILSGGGGSNGNNPRSGCSVENTKNIHFPTPIFRITYPISKVSISYTYM